MALPALLKPSLQRALEQERKHAQRDVSADLEVAVVEDGAQFELALNCLEVFFNLSLWRGRARPSRRRS